MSGHNRSPLLELVEMLGSGVNSAHDLYSRIHRSISIYIAIVTIVCFVCWIFNIIQLRVITNVAIFIMIPFSFVCLIRKDFVLGFSLFNIFRGNGSSTDLDIRFIERLVIQYFTIISSITYAAVWPLTILSSLDFSHQPSAFWVIVLCVMMLCLLEFVSESKKKFITNAVAIATPRKLLVQWLVNIVKLFAPNLSSLLS